MNTESIEKARDRADRGKGEELNRLPMRAFFFGKAGEKLGDHQDGEPVRSVGEAKSLGRRTNSRGFRIWLGKDAEQNPEISPWQHYIIPWPNSRFLLVNQTGFERFMSNVISREERREAIQFKRSLLDPAFPREEVSDDDGEA